jgi:hypothetical protein
MNCKVVFDYDVLKKFFSKSFIDNEYSDHLHKIWIAKDKARFQEDMEQAEKELKFNNLCKEISKIENELESLYKYIRTCDENRFYPYQFTINQISILINENKLKKAKKILSEIEIKKDEEPKIKYINKCNTASCNGLLNENYECILCNVKICKECNEIINDSDHVCDDNTLLTMKLIKVECKKCPKIDCDYSIYKIDGCNQMYCVKCHTAWDWITGKIETKRIHNPHFYEHIRSINNGEVPREQGDNECGENIPNIDNLIIKMKNLKVSSIIQRIISHIHRLYIHVDQVILDRWTDEIGGFEYNKRRNRINLLTSEIDENEYKKSLIRYITENELSIEISNIYNSLLSILKDKLQDIMICKDLNEFNEIFDSFDQVKYYINELIQNLSKKYNNRSFYLIDMSDDDDRIWTLTTTGRLSRKRKLNMVKEYEEDDD